MSHRRKVLIAGNSGLAGRAIESSFRETEKYEVFGAATKNADFRIFDSTRRLLQENKPDWVIISAAKVGGIIANKEAPVEFLLDNLKIQNNLLEACAEVGVERVIFLGSSCIYPKHAEQPIQEDSLMTGLLEESNESYALAKIAGLQLIRSYRQQYGFDWISLMPTNLYGPHDNFDVLSSHVIPGMIRKFHDAKSAGKSEIILWGTGSPKREFMFSTDLGKAVLLAAESYSDDRHLNIGSGQELSIRALAELVGRVVGFNGQISWDESFPDGTPRKLLDSSKIRSLGFVPAVNMEEGLGMTYEWFLKNVRG